MQKKVLLVEDSLLPRTVAKAMLEQLGCWVDTAETGAEAVVLCNENIYDLVLMDIGLPDITGLLATKLIRSQEETNNKKPVPIIALTANNDKIIQSQAQVVGMNGYLLKPLSLEQAQTILKDDCNRKKPLL